MHYGVDMQSTQTIIVFDNSTYLYVLTVHDSLDSFFELVKTIHFCSPKQTRNNRTESTSKLSQFALPISPWTLTSIQILLAAEKRSFYYNHSFSPKGRFCCHDFFHFMKG